MFDCLGHRDRMAFVDKADERRVALGRKVTIPAMLAALRRSP